jgi:glycerol-3-phosphate dehydrogenase
VKRNIREAANGVYDVVVVGGGIYGAAVAWDAVCRGLRVCLIEKSDFSSGTSANSLKIIHGGLRYLQHADLRRMRESIREQRTLMRIAPHLVHALPVLIPTYGHGLRSKEVLSTAVFLTRLIGFDPHRPATRASALPAGRAASRDEVVNLLPGFEQRRLTGGVIFFDAQVYNSERLLISFLRSASEAGAVLVNYAEVIGFLESQGCVSGVKARDSLSGNRFEVRGRTVVLACGPWTDNVTRLLTGSRLKPSGGFAKAVNIITRLIFEKYAVGVSTRERNANSARAGDNRNRLLFIAPWRDRSLIGTAYMDCKETPDELEITGPNIQELLDQVNAACPSADLKREEITFVHGGLVPLATGSSAGGSINLAQHYQIRDHRSEGVKGLISLIGVKYTTARDVAEKTVDHLFRSWDRKPPKARSSQIPLHGGQIECFDAFVKDEIAAGTHRWSEPALRRLICNYGSAYPEVLRYARERELGAPLTDDSALLKAEVLHGVRMEMAQKLSDVVFRRTELGSAGHPGKEALQICADAMSAELGWDARRTCRELQEVERIFAARH